MIGISEYMQRSREERTQHLNLDEPCGMNGGIGSNQYKGLLAYFLGTTIPTNEKVHLCHACGVGLCSNVRHLYWGTPSENAADAKAHGTWASISERTRKKHGEEYVKELAIRAAKKAGETRRARSMEQWEPHRHVFEEEYGTRGWPKRVSQRLGIEPEHARKIAKLLSIV